MIRYLNYGPRDFVENPDPPATRTGWQFYAFLTGKGAPRFTKKEAIPMMPRSLWVVRPGVEYRWRASNGKVQRAAFHFSNVPELLRAHIGEKNYLMHTLDDTEAAQILEIGLRLRPFYLAPSELLGLQSELALLELSLIFLKDAKHRRTAPLQRIHADRVRKAEEWYQANLKKRPTIDHVAMEVGLSTSQLRRDFKELYQLSPNAVFRRIRLYEATRLMANSDSTLDYIYPLAGFANEVDFYRCFKAEYKMSPHRWRMRLQVRET
jgi:AraC-like DNA-binding protein